MYCQYTHSTRKTKGVSFELWKMIPYARTDIKDLKNMIKEVVLIYIHKQLYLTTAEYVIFKKCINNF